MINFTIVSPKKTKHYNNLRGITLPAFKGQMEVLPGHVESFILLKKGTIIIHQVEKRRETVEILGGQCYIKGEKVVVIL